MSHDPNRPSVKQVQRHIADTPEPWPKIVHKRPAARTHDGSPEIPARLAGKRAIALRLHDAGLLPSQIAGRLSLPHAVVSGWVREVREKEGFR